MFQIGTALAASIHKVITDECDGLVNSADVNVPLMPIVFGERLVIKSHTSGQNSLEHEMASTSELLRGLFSPEQLASLESVRQVMQDDPTVFDNHSREVRTSPTQEKKDG